MENNKELTTEKLFEAAKNGDLFILSDPFVDKIKDSDGVTPLHYLASTGKIEVLSHPSVDKIVNRSKNTPLHLLARSGRIEVLTHPSVDKSINIYGNTPLHFLAGAGKIEVLIYSSVDEVKNDFGKTPLNMLFLTRYQVSKKKFKQIFPWCKLKNNQKITEKFLKDILHMKPSDFILSSIE